MDRRDRTLVDGLGQRRYHESPRNLTPADVYFGRALTIQLDLNPWNWSIRR